MRNIMRLLARVQKESLRQRAKATGVAVSETRLAEVDQAFDYIDRHLSGFLSGDNEGRMAEAMTTGDFPNALGEFVQRRMEPAYQRKRFNFEPFIKMDTTPNYLTVTRYQMRAGVEDLEYVAPKGSPRAGSVVDGTKREYQVHDWQKLFDFDMHALANDDLGYFDDLASLMGQAARRTLEKFVSRMYTNATSIARLTGLGALFSTTGRLTSDRISTARMAFNQRVDDRGEPINAALRYLVVHQGLEDIAATILNSQLVPETDQNAVNIVAGQFEIIPDPYITGTAPNLPWWAFTDYRANNISPFVLARRAGVPAPLLLRRKNDMELISQIGGGGRDVSPLMGDFITGNVQFKVHDVWGTYVDGTEGNLYDYRGAYYSSGTTP